MEGYKSAKLIKLPSSSLPNYYYQSCQIIAHPFPIITQPYLILLNYCQTRKTWLAIPCETRGERVVCYQVLNFHIIVTITEPFFQRLQRSYGNRVYGEWSEPRENARASCAAARGGGSRLFPLPSHSRAAFTWLLRHDSTKWRPCAQARERANSMK